jgi:hypothetical protein
LVEAELAELIEQNCGGRAGRGRAGRSSGSGGAIEAEMVKAELAKLVEAVIETEL